MDSLRYWVTECHVDGFRFDLASALAREFFDVDRLSAFFDVIHQDPVLSQVKLIAEPWDVGPGGYQVGNFPILWSEWNGVYRDDDARLLARLRQLRGIRRAPVRLRGPVRVRRPRAVRLDQLHHRPRRLHPARSRLLQRQAQRGQPRGQPGRHRRQPLVELRRRGRDRRSRGAGAARTPAAELPHHAVHLPGHADAARRRRDRPHPVRQQQRLVPGQRDLLVRLDRDAREDAAARVHPAADPAAPRAPGVPPGELPARRRSSKGSGLPGRVVVPRRRAEDDPQGLAGRRARARDVPQRRGDPDAGPAGRGHRGRLVPGAVQRPPRGPLVHAAAPALRRAVGARALDRRSRGRGRKRALRRPHRGPGDGPLDRDAQASVA